MKRKKKRRIRGKSNNNNIHLESNLKKSCLYPQIFNLQFLCIAGYLKHSNENIDSSNDKYTNYNIIEILS